MGVAPHFKRSRIITLNAHGRRPIEFQSRSVVVWHTIFTLNFDRVRDLYRTNDPRKTLVVMERIKHEFKLNVFWKNTRLYKPIRFCKKKKKKRNWLHGKINVYLRNYALVTKRPMDNESRTTADGRNKNAVDLPAGQRWSSPRARFTGVAKILIGESK